MRAITQSALVAAVLAATGFPALAEPRWPTISPSYTYVPAAGCDRPAAIVVACTDQMAVFTAARAAAVAEQKSLLVVFGATWCPSCRTLKPALPAALSANGLTQRVHVVEITLSTLDRGKITPVPSGDAVKAALLLARPEFKVRAIPFVAVIDPGTGRTSARNLDDLEQGGGWSGKGLARVITAAEVEARGGQAAPSEPSWLMRKWKRWIGE